MIFLMDGRRLYWGCRISMLKIYGLPFHDGPECLIYRKDLFENENEKLAFKKVYGRELAPPRTMG